MLPVSIADLATMTRYLEDLLGADRVAELRTDEIRYLASLVHEELPDLPQDEITDLLTRHEGRQLARIRARLAVSRRNPRRTGRQVRTTTDEPPVSPDTRLVHGPEDAAYLPHPHEAIR